jgi:hypothetical protein
MASTVPVKVVLNPSEAAFVGVSVLLRIRASDQVEARAPKPTAKTPNYNHGIINKKAVVREAPR